MLLEEQTNEGTPTVALKKKRARKVKADIVQDFACSAPPTCALLGLEEKETEHLFTVGTVYISADAVEVLNAQLAKLRREKRGA